VLLLEEGILRASPRAVEALHGHLRPVAELVLVHIGASVGVVAEHDGEVDGAAMRERHAPGRMDWQVEMSWT